MSEYCLRCYAKNPSISAREIAGEFILIPTRQVPGDGPSIYALNEVSRFVWALVDGRRQVTEIRDAIVDEFEVGSEEAGADLIDFLRQLEEVGAIVVV